MQTIRQNAYHQLNELVASDPAAAARILILDPTGYSSARDLVEDSRTKLTAMIASWPNQSQKYTLGAIMRPLSEIAAKEDSTLSPANTGNYQRRESSVSTDLALLNISIGDEHMPGG